MTALLLILGFWAFLIAFWGLLMWDSELVDAENEDFADMDLRRMMRKANWR